MSEQKPRVSGQFFQWFDVFKQGYESSMNKLFNRVEAVNESHKQQLEASYHGQIASLEKNHQTLTEVIEKSAQSQLDDLRKHQREQNGMTQNRMNQLEKDIEFYQQQIRSQSQTIDKLNARYDAVLLALRDQLDNKVLETMIKDIAPSVEQNPVLQNHLDSYTKPISLNQPSAEQPSISHGEQNTEHSAEDHEQDSHQYYPPGDDNTNSSSQEMAQSPTRDDNPPAAPDHQSLVEQAYQLRKTNQFEQAYELFMTAARQGNGKAMGAIGRANFMGEGVEPNKTLGLAWLILAAENDFEPAIKKVESAQQQSPQLYQAAVNIAVKLLI